MVLNITKVKTHHTSWEKIAREYHQALMNKKHSYHDSLILPKVMKLSGLNNRKKDIHILDVGCGQGILERSIHKKTHYLGIDISPTLINIARRSALSENHSFLVHDLMKPLPDHIHSTFDQALAILSLQNMENPLLAMKNVFHLLKHQGSFTIVLNHPCFRIPRMTAWGEDTQKKLIYRRIDRYYTPQQVPILTNPSKKHSETTTSFHFPLEYWCSSLSQVGFYIETMEEWVSPKKSYGSRAKAENLSRKEFPLFLTIKTIKKQSILNK